MKNKISWKKSKIIEEQRKYNIINTNKKIKKIFFICGELSGNNIIEQILLKLKQDNVDLNTIELQGVINNEVANKLNIKQIFSSQELALLGLGDILFKIPYILKKINEVKQAILNFQPDLIISVDAYDFNIRVAKKIKQSLTSINNKYFNPYLIHIVAPSVWAYWKGRAKTLMKYYNHLFYFLPMEKQYFPNNQTKNNIFTSTFVGFPAVFQKTDNTILKNPLQIGITLGSRKSEIQRHKHLILGVLMRLKIYESNLKFTILATKNTSIELKNYFNKIKNLTIIDEEEQKKIEIQHSCLVIAKSGTNNIEIGALKTAFITYYKTSFLTYFFALIFAKIKFINLFNIIANKMIVPEFVQHNANIDNISRCAINFLINENLKKNQIENVSKIIKEMKHISCKEPIEIISETLEHNFFNKK